MLEVLHKFIMSFKKPLKNYFNFKLAGPSWEHVTHDAFPFKKILFAIERLFKLLKNKGNFLAL